MQLGGAVSNVVVRAEEPSSAGHGGAPVSVAPRATAGGVIPDFGNVVDALIYMDLRIMPTRLQDFYFTAEGGAKFRAFHGIEVPVK